MKIIEGKKVENEKKEIKDMNKKIYLKEKNKRGRVIQTQKHKKKILISLIF